MEKLFETYRAQYAAVSGRLAELEGEMGAVSGAVDRMSRDLALQLERLLAMQRDAGATLDRSLLTQQETLATSVAGFAAGSAAMARVDAAVVQNTTAVIKTDVLRLQGDADAPLSHVKGFSAEIEERFHRALVSVMTNRQLYDQHFNDIMIRHARNLRLIGEHIYRVMDEEFGPAVEARVRIPHDRYRELAWEVDRRRVELRGKRLEQKLEEFDASELDPLLDMQRKFETEVAAGYAVDLPAGLRDVTVAGCVRCLASGEADAVVGTDATEDPGGLERAGYGVRLAEDPDFTEIRQGLQARARRIAGAARRRSLKPEELERVSMALAGLSMKGRIHPDCLGILQKYLGTHGLEVFEDGTVELGADQEA